MRPPDVLSHPDASIRCTVYMPLVPEKCLAAYSRSRSLPSMSILLPDLELLS